MIEQATWIYRQVRTSPTSILISRPLRLRITRRDDLGLVVAIGR